MPTATGAPRPRPGPCRPSASPEFGESSPIEGDVQQFFAAAITAPFGLFRTREAMGSRSNKGQGDDFGRPRRHRLWA